MENKATIILSAGGTGGHLFPAEALGEELAKRGYDVHLATDERAKRFVKGFDDKHLHVIRSATIKGKNPIALVKTLWGLLKGVRQSRLLYRQLKPKLVVGFGGYPTLPPLYEATKQHIPTLIHEQNGVMGRANKALAAKVNAIAGGFLQSADTYNNKLIVTGNPVRKEVLEASKTAYHPSTKTEPFHLLIFGGSQGASFFSEALPDAIKRLPEDFRKRLRLVQQARDNIDALKEEYLEIGIDANIASFFDDMASKIAQANFIIARSGASTVSEIAVIGRPALLVPYPYALDHDQAANAAALAETGSVLVVTQSELNDQKLSDIIKAAMEDYKLMAIQAQSAKLASHPDATQKLADLAEKLIADQTIEEIKKEIAS